MLLISAGAFPWICRYFVAHIGLSAYTLGAALRNLRIKKLGPPKELP